jgi:hypothetical protein
VMSKGDMTLRMHVESRTRGSSADGQREFLKRVP